VLRRLRRPTLLLTSVLLPAALLTACGGADDGSVLGDAREGLDAVSVSGDVGSKPEVDWKSQMTVDETDVAEVTEGDGEELATDDQVLLDYYVGNGFTEDEAVSTYGKQPVTGTLPVGGEPTQPTDTQDPATVARYLIESFVLSQVEAGDTVGTRKVVVANSADVVGYGGFDLGIGNEDGLLIVVDVVGKAADKPSGASAEPEAWVPTITTAEQRPSALDFAGTAPPAEFLRSQVLIEGEGEPLERGDLAAVKYLGQTFDGDEPFDTNYDAPGTFVLRLGAGGVIKGWEQGLTGVPVGSRVVLGIPPRLGYGDQGSPSGGIQGDDTLYFVIDVLAGG